MEQIKVIKIASKETKTGKPYKMCEVECGGEVRKVNIWSNAPDFANIQEGSVIMGKMAMDGQYWNISFENAPTPRGGASGGFKQAQIEKTMDKKNESISKFQTNKEESIKLMSAQRDAVLMVVNTIGKNGVEWENQDLKQMIIEWRNWFLNDKEFNNPPPF